MVNEEITSRYHVTNAGMIICNPFLTQLFTMLDYLNEQKQFKDEESRFRAVFLLQYIATGQLNDIEEPDLLFAKILCGVPVHQPVPLNILLTQMELNTGLELLEVVISKWDKLGNTSPDGLRNTFLNRNGLVEIIDNSCQVSVETSGTDILLDYIPWNINIVNLPWLAQIIYTSWR